MKDTALLFSGQGAQYEGMGNELCSASLAAKAVYDEASEALGYDLLALDALALADTRHTQLATFTLSMAAYAALGEGLGDQASRLTEATLAGFSLGEYSALTAAGVIDFPSALKLLSHRSLVMAEAAAASDGAMYAIMGLDDSVILEELNKELYRDRVYAANFNSPGQLVIAGYQDSLELASAALLELGAKRAVRLSVSGAFHTPLMATAAESLGDYAKQIDFKRPSKTLYSNVTAEMLDVTDYPEYLSRHMLSSVRWTGTVMALGEAGITRYVELGPGKTLIGLARRVDRKAAFYNIEDKKSLETCLEGLWL